MTANYFARRWFPALLLVLAATAPAQTPTSTSAAPVDPPPVPTREIRFAAGASAATVDGALNFGEYEYSDDQTWSLRAQAGQRLHLHPDTAAIRYTLLCPDGHGTLAGGSSERSIELPQSGAYQLLVNAAGKGKSGSVLPYRMEVEVTGNAQAVALPHLAGTYELGFTPGAPPRQLAGNSRQSKLEIVERSDGSLVFHLLALFGNDAPHTGEAQGILHPQQGAAIYRDPGCDLRFVFGRDQHLHIDQPNDCGMGAGVSAEGDYTRSSVCAAPFDTADLPAEWKTPAAGLAWTWQGTRATVPASVEQAAHGDWKKLIRQQDRDALQLWHHTVEALLEHSRPGGTGAADREFVRTVLTAVPQPLDLAALPDTWRCRSLQVDASDVFAYPDFTCRIGTLANGALVFEKTSGSQRRSGLLFRDADPQRLILLGGSSVNDEPQRAYDFGADSAPDEDFSTWGVLLQLERDHLLLVLDVTPQRFEIYDLHRGAGRKP